MKQNFDLCLKKLLQDTREGGFSNNSKDPGGITNHGVTKRVWEAWAGHPVTEQDMRELTTQQVAPLYHKEYWSAIKGDDLPAGLDHCVFDCAVNSGVERATRFLLHIMEQPQDGTINPDDLISLEGKQVRPLINLYCDLRQGFLETLPTFETFGKGWTRRVSEVRAEALIMA